MKSHEINKSESEGARPSNPGMPRPESHLPDLPTRRIATR